MTSNPNKFEIIYHHTIQEFMKEQDLPKWYRGLSKFQLEAASSLHVNLRDDMEQDTTHRTQQCLMRLGLEPAINNKKIKLVMKLSKGQDLAFLWFLMDIYYKNACDNCSHPVYVYNVNEQICFSAIAHLDLITTLREMDTHLPRQPYQYHEQLIKEPKPIKPTKNTISPYQQKLVRPKQKKPIAYFQGKPIVPNFKEYSVYSKAYYIVPNETNRWYITYKFQHGKRFLNQIVNDAVDEIFRCLSTGCTLNYLLTTKYKNAFCLVHKGDGERKALQRAKEIVRIKENLTAYLDVSAGGVEQSKKRVTRELFQEADDINKKRGGCQRKVRPSNPTSKQSPPASYVKNFNSPTHPFYFKGPTDHSPYSFNFHMIFRELISNRKSMNYCINKAMNMDCDIDEDQAVKMVCKEMWYKAMNETKKTLAAEKKKQMQKAARTTYHFKSLSYYDPRDSNLMDEMLQECIRNMRKNNKFVLASLPDVHKLPILREWIRARYGFSYTPAEIALSVKQSKMVFANMKKVTFKKPFSPAIIDFSLEPIITFACQPLLREKAAKVYGRYSHDVKFIIMDMARIFWEAMKPYQCPLGPPRDTFFAYAPGYMSGIFMFRPS